LLLESVAGAMPGNARLFAFGVGDDVDTTLLDTLTQKQRGTTTYVRPNQAIDEAVSSFYAKVGTPVLTDLLLDYGGIRVEQLYPAELPDLFAGSQLVVAGRYREGGPATITLRGTTNGREQLFTYPDQRFRDEVGEAFIPRLWATRAIGHLMQQIRLQGEDPELVQSIVSLSTRYGIITPYTSFLIEEDDILNQIGQPAAEEPMEAAIEALAAPTNVSGATAVDRAATESELMTADTQLVEATRVVTEVLTENGVISQPVVQTVGGKTFFWRNNQWVDSTFNADGATPQVIPFASDAYFELLGARPELGQFLALGEQMILVVDGQAYQVTAEGEEQGSGGAEEQGDWKQGDWRVKTRQMIRNLRTRLHNHPVYRCVARP
jgi:Ca-activated chloride channel family protein